MKKRSTPSVIANCGFRQAIAVPPVFNKGRYAAPSLTTRGEGTE